MNNPINSEGKKWRKKNVQDINHQQTGADTGTRSRQTGVSSIGGRTALLPLSALSAGHPNPKSLEGLQPKLFWWDTSHRGGLRQPIYLSKRYYFHPSA